MPDSRTRPCHPLAAWALAHGGLGALAVQKVLALVLVQVLPLVVEEPEAATLYITPASAPGDVAYVWKCPRGPHIRGQP
jgi:hypothetical protein